MQRLDKFLCDSGAGTRSQVKLILRAGRVAVDGQPEKDGSRKIDPESQNITLDGEVLGGKYRAVFLMNKPAGYVTATEDPREPTVMELLPQDIRYLDLKPVGRLDKATEGLLLFTNDGQLSHRILSPRHQVWKRYYAEHEGEAGPADVEAFEMGITLKDGDVCLPARLLPQGPGKSIVEVCEGKYHQVRRMLASRGMPVTYLKRIAEGSLELGPLELGKVREVELSEWSADN